MGFMWLLSAVAVSCPFCKSTYMDKVLLVCLPCAHLELFIMMKPGDHLVQETLLCRVPGFSCESKLLKRSLLEVNSFLVRLLIMKFANHSVE